MPLFNEASRIYSSVEVNFMRSCFAQSAIILEESDRSYSATELAECIIRLYESGLRDLNYISELAARLAHSRFEIRHHDFAANTDHSQKFV
ncbi:hypothetical protein F9K97_16595 [Brucella anthropi]|jgi:hypothetical protein|nr:hypothetical protein F9K97_16595 [Brucella anthropi]KAB2790096.1 hypothetical protein F9K96_13985 [Brucella anthropi]NIH75096.1 hypothetical protein [Ochrobactrum sp. P20RRXII]